MKWNEHCDLKGQHAFLSASKYSWLNYDKDKLRQVYANAKATEHGTKLHQIASDLIKEGIKLPKNKQTINLFVNDAIGFQMRSEQLLYYSKFCFGTADAISFKDGFLRIHDLKTGKIPAHMDQLKIYAAIFCLEYDVRPKDITGIELRIYQSGEIVVYNPEVNEITEIKKKIVEFDKLLSAEEKGYN